jgi:hypothetical protein
MRNDFKNEHISLLIDKKYTQQKTCVNNMFMSGVFILARHPFNYPYVQLNILTSNVCNPPKKSICPLSKILFICKFLSTINRVKRDVLSRVFFLIIDLSKTFAFLVFPSYTPPILYIDYCRVNGMNGSIPSICSWGYEMKMQTFEPDT